MTQEDPRVSSITIGIKDPKPRSFFEIIISSKRPINLEARCLIVENRLSMFCYINNFNEEKTRNVVIEMFNSETWKNKGDDSITTFEKIVDQLEYEVACWKATGLKSERFRRMI